MENFIYAAIFFIIFVTILYFIFKTTKIEKPKIIPKIWKDTKTNLTWQTQLDDKKYRFKEKNNFLTKINDSKYGGFNDWRVPTLEELKTITSKDYTTINGHDKYIKTPLVEYINIDIHSVWSIDAYETNSNIAWCVNFANGKDFGKNIETRLSFIAVR
jgi:hypothetical protein